MYGLKTNDAAKAAGPGRVTRAKRLAELLRSEPKESIFRSAFKSVGYRLYSSCLVTPVLSFAATQRLNFALDISLTEMAVKPFTYLAFERVASKFGTGYRQMDCGAKETEARSITKAVAYRLYSSAVSSAIAYGVTHQLKYSLGMGAMELVVKPFTYYAFERGASRLKKGYT